MLAGAARGSPPKVVEIFQKTVALGNRMFPRRNDDDDACYWGRWDWGKTLDDGSRMIKHQANRRAEDAGWENLARQTPYLDVSWAVIPSPCEGDPASALEMLSSQFEKNYMTDPATHERTGSPKDPKDKGKKSSAPTRISPGR